MSHRLSILVVLAFKWLMSSRVHGVLVAKQVSEIQIMRDGSLSAVANTSWEQAGDASAEVPAVVHFQFYKPALGYGSGPYGVLWFSSWDANHASTGTSFAKKCDQSVATFLETQSMPYFAAVRKMVVQSLQNMASEGSQDLWKGFISGDDKTQALDTGEVKITMNSDSSLDFKLVVQGGEQIFTGKPQKQTWTRGDDFRSLGLTYLSLICPDLFHTGNRQSINPYIQVSSAQEFKKLAAKVPLQLLKDATERWLRPIYENNVVSGLHDLQKELEEVDKLEAATPGKGSSRCIDLFMKSVYTNVRQNWHINWNDVALKSGLNSGLLEEKGVIDEAIKEDNMNYIIDLIIKHQIMDLIYLPLDQLQQLNLPSLETNYLNYLKERDQHLKDWDVDQTKQFALQIFTARKNKENNWLSKKGPEQFGEVGYPKELIDVIVQNSGGEESQALIAGMNLEAGLGKVSMDIFSKLTNKCLRHLDQKAKPTGPLPAEKFDLRDLQDISAMITGGLAAFNDKPAELATRMEQRFKDR